MPDAKGRTEYHYVLVDYVCKVVGGELSPADDVSRAEWVPIRQASNLMMTEGTLDVIHRAYQNRNAEHQRRHSRI